MTLVPYLVLLTTMVTVSWLAAAGRMFTYLRHGVTPRRFPWIYTFVTVVSYPIRDGRTVVLVLWGVLVVLCCVHVALWSVGREADAQ